jgi:hypothetical protein
VPSRPCRKRPGRGSLSRLRTSFLCGSSRLKPGAGTCPPSSNKAITEHRVPARLPRRSGQRTPPLLRFPALYHDARQGLGPREPDKHLPAGPKAASAARISSLMAARSERGRFTRTRTLTSRWGYTFNSLVRSSSPKPVSSVASISRGKTGKPGTETGDSSSHVARARHSRA